MVMADVERKPDEQDSEQMTHYLRRLWLPVHSQWASGPDPWYFQTAQIWDEKLNRPNIVPPEARAIIDHGTDVFLTFTPTFHRVAAGDGDNRDIDRDAVKAGLLAVFMDSQTREMSIPFKDAAHYLNMYDYAVVEGPLLNVAARPIEPKEEDYDSEEEFRWAMIDYRNSKKFWNPIIIRSPHPATVLLDPSSKDPEEAVKPLRMLVKDVDKMLADARKRKEDGREDVEINESRLSIPDRRYEKVKGEEFWTKDWHWVTLQDSREFLYIERNAWGFLPYTHGFANYGYMSTKAATGEDEAWLPEVAKGLLDPLTDMLRMDAQGMAAKHNALVEQGFPRPGYRHGAEEGREQLTNTDGVLEGDQTDWWWFQVPELNRSIFQIGEEVKGQIAVGSYVRDVAGVRQQGVDTVGQQAILSQAANRKFDAAKVTLDHMVTLVARNILRLVDRMEEKLHAGGEVIDPQQIHHDYNVVGQFQVIDPVLQLQQRELGMREYGAQLKSDVTYRETDLRVGNETEEVKRLTEQFIRQDEFVKSKLAEPTAEEMGLGDVWRARHAAMFGQQPEQMAAPGRNGETPQISDQAGGGATRGIRQALTGDAAKPPRVNVPPEGI